MFEFHGWVTIRDSAGCDDLEDDPSAATLEAIRAAISDCGMENDASLTERNVLWMLTFHGLSNHRSTPAVELFERVARLAAGSYGVLMTHDDEAGLRPGFAYADEVGESDRLWYRRVMRRGAVERYEEPLFSPHIGTLEDDCSAAEPDDGPG